MEIKRDRYLNRLISRERNGMTKVVTGMRRCGKSYLLFNLFKNHLLNSGVRPDHIICIALDSLEDEPLLDANKLYSAIKGSITDDDQYYVLLDEIQLVDRFEKVINSLMRMSNADIYVTGSNSKMLSSDIITEFRGRADEVRVMPLSFSEFVTAYDGTDKEAWDDYTEYGGLPEILMMKGDEQKSAYLASVLNKTYLKDIKDRYSIRIPSALDGIFDVLSSSVGSLTNPKRLRDTLRTKGFTTIDDSTVSSYIGYLEDAFLFEKSSRYDVKRRFYFDTPSKYYATDIGIRNVRLNFRQSEETHLMENVIYNELRSRGFTVDVGIVDYTETTDGKRVMKRTEIDFVANKGKIRYYIQSAYMMDDDKRKTEIRPFLKVNDSFGKFIIVNGSSRPHVDDNGIITMGIIDFLKNDRSLENPF